MDTHANSAPALRGEVGRARANLDALRLLHTLQEKQRTPTQDERRVLAHWSGWGPLTRALESNRSGAWAEIGDDLAELLTPTQLQQGLEACTSSFYTPPEVMDACWQLLTGLGFSAGAVLEPGCGSGDFLSATPAHVQARWLGVEPDETSAAIARHLHPEAMIMHRPMEEANLPPFSRDAVIGNVPFSEVGVFDPTAPEEVTRTLHDYMIWSSIQALAPGGIAVLVTSCGTLDKVNDEARLALDAEAALIGAVRLPSDTFNSQGTGAPADILVLRRRTGDEPRFDPKKPEVADLPEDELLAALARGTWTRATEGHNAYFHAFPETMLGTTGRHPVYSGQVDVIPDPERPWQQALPQAVASIVERAASADLVWRVLQAPGELAVSSEAADLGLYEGQILTVERQVEGRDGASSPRQVIAQVVAGQIEEVRTAQGNLKVASDELLALIELRDAARELFAADADTQEVSDDELAVIRERALDRYQAYTERHGPIGRTEISYQNRKDENGQVREVKVNKTPSLGGIRADTEFATLLALEDYDVDTDTAAPADILRRRVHAAVEEVTRADTPAEAVALSLNAHNGIDEDYVAALLGVDPDRVPELLATEHAAFRDPRYPTGALVPAATYLSGSIGQKLEQAREVAETDPAFHVNVQALEAAIPATVPAEKIDARLGAPWIPPKVVEQFAREVLEVRVDVGYYRATGDWVVKIDDWFPEQKDSVPNSEQWAFTPPRPDPGKEMPTLVGWDPEGDKPLRYGHQLLEKALNNGTPTINQQIEDKRLEHPEFTRAAAKVKERIERAFAAWVWQDATRAQELTAAFNRDVASTRPPAYRGSALTFPGISNDITPHTHQVDFVARALATEPGAGGICAHVMGGGKTISMFMTAIKHVRLGLATNPIIVVPNGLLSDITREGKQLFPGARILMATNDDLAGPEARRRFAYKCVANTWDAIVMTTSLFERIPIDRKSESDFHARHKAQMAATFAADAKNAQGAHAKRISKKIKAREKRSKELLSHGPRDETLSWSRVAGSRPLVIVDEASDLMRNLGEYVQAEGISMSKPANAADAYAKIRLAQEAGGKVLPFTGTPYVRNAIDLYTLMYIVDPKRLERHGIFSGDDFARMFLRFETVLEPTANGAGVNLRVRVRSLINEEHLRALFAEFADVKRDRDLNLDLPELEQITHRVEASPALRALADDLALRETQLKGWQTEKGDDTYLSLVATGRSGALDPALVGLPEDGPSKLDVMADQIAERYHQTRDFQFPDDPSSVNGLLQLVFINQGVPSKGKANTYGRLRDKLVERGVPADRIEFVHDHDGPRKRPKLYAGARRANPNVLIGSFAKMGYGTNVQTRLSDIHIGDVEWNPADLIQAIKRGHRQGNRLPKLTVRYYPVEFSIDARMFSMNWQRLVVQEQALDPEHRGGVSGEAGEFRATQLGSLSAIASGNPRLQELEDLNRKLEDLEDEAANHESLRKRSLERIDKRTQEIADLETERGQVTILARVVADHVDTTFYEGTSTNPLSDKQVAPRLNAATRAAIARDNPAASTCVTYRGLRVRTEWAPAGDEFAAYAVVHTDDAAYRVGLNEKWTRKGQSFRLLRAVQGAIDRLPELPDQLSDQIAQLGLDNESTRGLLGAPFERSAELEALRTEVAVLEEELAREQEDLADRVQRAEALALREVTPLLNQDGSHTHVGWEPSGQMALDVVPDHMQLLRPPPGWSERAAPGRTRLGRALHGSHWVLTHDTAPFDSPLDYTAHLASTPSGMVLARVYVTGNNRSTGQDTVTQLHLSELHPTYGEALAAVRHYLLRDLPKLHDPGFRPPSMVGTQVWDPDIERLVRHSPLTVLHAGLSETRITLPARSMTLTAVALRDLQGRYALVRLTNGHLMAHTINSVDSGEQVQVGDMRLEPELVAEVVSLDPHHPHRYLQLGQEPTLTPDLMWRMAAHPGDPLTPASRSLRRNIHSTAGLAAQGRKVECVIDRRDLGHTVAEAERFVSVHATVQDTDDSHLRLKLPTPLREMALHTPTDHVSHLAVRRDDQEQPTADENVLYRVPLSAVVSVRVDNTTRRWERQVQKAALATPEPETPQTDQEAHGSAEALHEHPRQAAEDVRLTPEQIHARAFEALEKALAADGGLHGQLREDADRLLSSDRGQVVGGYLGVAAILVRAAEDDLPGFHEQRGLAHHVARALSQEGEYTAAVQVRDAFTLPSDSATDWRTHTAWDAHQWVLGLDEPIDHQITELLRTDPQGWDTSEPGFNRVRSMIEGHLAQGRYHNAAVLIDKAKEAFIDRVTSRDWTWKALEARYHTVVIAAAHTHIAAIGHPSGPPRPVPFPHGLGLLIGRHVAILHRDGDIHLAGVRDFDHRRFLVTHDGAVFQDTALVQVRTTDNQYMALASGEPEQMEEALGSLAERMAAERTEFTRPFREELADWIGTQVQVHTPRTVLADGLLEEITPTGLRIRVPEGTEPHTVRFEVIDSLTSEGRPRWWADPRHNSVAQHLAAADRFLHVDDHFTARRHLGHAKRTWLGLEPSSSRQRQEIEQTLKSLTERALSPQTRDGAPLVQIERSGPQGRLVRVFGIEQPDEATREVLESLVRAEPPLLFSEQDNAYVPNATWRERNINARLEQLEEDLGTAGVAFQALTLDHPEPALPSHPATVGHTAEPVQDRAPTSPEPAPAPRTRSAPEDVPASAPAPPTSAGASDGSTPAKAVDRAAAAPAAGEDDQRGPEVAVGLEELNLVPGELVVVRTRHDVSGVKDPLRQLLIGTFEVVDGPLQRHSALTFSQGDRSFTTPLDNILEMVSTDGARHWRRDASRPSLIEDLLGLHALALDPAAPAQLPRTLIRLGRLPSEHPDLDSGTRSDAVSYSGAASYQTLFIEQLVDLVTDGAGAVPTPGDPPLAGVDPLRRQIAVRIIDAANLSSPLGIAEREALRSRLVHTDRLTVPDTAVRFDSQAAAIRVSSATPEETAALDTLLRQRSIGFSQPAQDGTTTTWELRPSWSAETKAVRLRKALYVLHREGHAIIPEDLWHHLTASDKPLPANEDEAAPAPHEGTAEPLGPTTEVQLSGRPELRTPEFHGANQALLEALKRGDLATAQRIYEFRTDPREGALPNYVQQPGYELFAELGQAISDAQTVDSAVLRVMYQARDADLEHGDHAEALDLLALAEEISPENGQHTAELHRIRSALEAREVPGEEPIQELEDLSSGTTAAPAPPAPERAQDEVAQQDDLERRLELARSSLGRGDYVTARGHLARADAALADVVAAGGPEAERWQRAHDEIVMRASSPRDAAGEPLLHIERTGPDGRQVRVYGAGGGHEPVSDPLVHRILEASPRLIRDRDRNAYRTGPEWRDRTVQTRVDRLIQDLQDAGLPFAVITLPHPEPDLPATPAAVRTPAATENHLVPAHPPAWMAQEPEAAFTPAAAPTEGGDLDGLFAVEPQAPTAEDVRLALDNVAAIPNPLGVFNGDQTWLAARARDAYAEGDIAAATAYLTHQRMNEGRAASKLQAAVGHLVRFAPTAGEGHEASEPPTPAPAAQEQIAAQEATQSVDHLFRAVIYRFDDTKIYVPADAPPEWREAIARHGWRFDDDHAPWADSGASRGDMGRLREDFAKLTDPPAFIEAKVWAKRIREARGAEASDERLRQLRDVDQRRAHAEIAELIATGDVRAAFAVMTEHTTALREAGLLPDVWVIDPDQGLADLYPVPQRASRDNAHEIRRQVRARDSWSAQEVADLAEQVHRQCPHLNAEQAAEILPEPSPTPKNPHVARAVEALAEMRQSSYLNGRRSVRRRLDAVVEEVKGRRVDRDTALELFAEYARIDPPAAAEVERGRARVALPTVDTPGFSDALVIREDFNHVVVHTPNDLDERVRQALTDHGFTAAEPGRFENRAHRPPPGDQLGRFLHTLNQLPDAPERMPATHHDRLMLGPAGARRVEHLPADPLPAEELHTAVVVSPDDHWILLPPGAPQAWHDILTGHGMDGGGFIVRRSEEAFAAEAEAITADLRAADPPARVMDLTDWQAHHRALVGDAAFEARHDALEVAQFQARDRLHDHLEEGDVLAAEAVALEHQTALWRAGLVHNPRQLDPERGLVDLSSEVWRRSLRNGEALLREIDQTQAWDEPSLTAMVDRLRRESPLLSEALLDRLPSELREELATTEAPLGSQALAPVASDQTPQQAPAPHDLATEEPAARLAAQTGARIVVFDEEQATLAVGTLEEVSAEGVRVREFLRSTLVPFEDIAGASTENGYWWADAQREVCQQAIMAADTAWDQRDFTAAATHVEQATAYWETGPMPSPAQQNLLRFFFDQTRERLKLAQALQKQSLNWEYTTEPGYVSNPHLYVIGEGEQAQRLTPAEARALYLDGERDQTTAAKPVPQAPMPTPEPNTNTPGRGDPGAPMQQTESPDTPPEEERLGAAGQALKSLSAQASPEHRDQLNTALQHLLDHDQHTDVARLARDADLVDPAGWWERADLLSTARFAHDPDSLATAVRIDYDGAKSTTVRITGDDSDRPVRELIKDKSGPYKARYDKSNQHWKINRKRKSVEDYRALLSDLLSDLDGLGRTWVTETVHTELTERHRARAEAALAAGEAVAPVTADGHVGELADVLTYPALRVSAVIRQKDRHGEPRDAWIVVYDTGQGAELTEYTATEPTVRRGQVLTDVQVKIHDHAFSAQGEARTVIIRVPPRQERKFPLTPEQDQIRTAALEGKKFEVHAGAGTGKTATIGVVAESLAEQGRRGVYVVYGRANADEAAVKLAHVPIAANTIHAFARRAVGGPYSARINGDKTPHWQETARALGLRSIELPSGHPLDGEDLARLVDRAVQTFELSADLELSTAHIPRLPGLGDHDHGRVQSLLKPVLDRAWADMCDPAGTLFRYRHDTYVKIWQLTPGGPKMRIGGQGRPYLLVDEAQDMNPVAEAILQSQTHMQQGWVGDSSQAVHGWRGAEDALGRQNADVVLTLSQSFRFGEAVAAEANRWLDAIDARLRVKGTPTLDTVVHDHAVEAPDAVLARTNAGAFNAAMAQLQAGRRVAIVGGTDDLTKLVDAADKLKDGNRTTHPDLSHFRSWDAVVKAANDRPEDLGSLAPFVRLVDKLGTSAVRGVLAQMTDTDPEVEVCTAHKSKGLEWDRVQIADDFAPKEDQEWSLGEFRAEAQLAYVAVTRARKELGRGSLSYIDDYVGTASTRAAAEDSVLGQEQAPAADEAVQDSAAESEESEAIPSPDLHTSEESEPAADETPARELEPAAAEGDAAQAAQDLEAEAENVAEARTAGAEPTQEATEARSEFAPGEDAQTSKATSDHEWVPDIPLLGALESSEAVERIRVLTGSLQPKLVRAMSKPPGSSGTWNNGLNGQESTPRRHLLELEGLELIRRDGGQWYLTRLGEAVHNMLWRQQNGPDMDLPATARGTEVEPSAPHPTLFDAEPEPFQEAVPAPSGAERIAAGDAAPSPEAETAADPGEVTTPKPDAEEAQEQDGLSAVEQQTRSPRVEPPVTGDSAPTEVDPKEAFDHGWVPRHIMAGELEHGPELDRVRALAASLPPRLVRAMERWTAHSSHNRKSLDWDSTPPRHMEELREQELVFRERERWWFTYLGEAVHDLLWRHKYGPEKDLPITEGLAVEEPQPSLFDAAQEPGPVSQQPERTPPPPPDQVEQPQNAPALDPEAEADPESHGPAPQMTEPDEEVSLWEQAPVEVTMPTDAETVPPRVQRPTGWGGAVLDTTPATAEQQQRCQRYLDETVDGDQRHRLVQALSQDLTEHMAAGRWDTFTDLHRALAEASTGPEHALWHAHGQAAQRALDNTGDIVAGTGVWGGRSARWEHYAQALTHRGSAPAQDPVQARTGLRTLANAEYLQDLIAHTVTTPPWRSRHLGWSLLALVEHDHERAAAAASMAQASDLLGQEEAETIHRAAAEARATAQNNTDPEPQHQTAEEQDRAVDDYEQIANDPALQPDPAPASQDPAAETPTGPGRTTWPPFQVRDPSAVPPREGLVAPGEWAVNAAAQPTQDPLARAQTARAPEEEVLARAASRVSDYVGGRTPPQDRDELVRALSQDLVDHMAAGRWDEFGFATRALIPAATETERPLWHAHLNSAQAALERAHGLITAGVEGDPTARVWAYYAQVADTDIPVGTRAQAEHGLRALVHNDYLATLPAYTAPGPEWMDRHLRASLEELAPHHPHTAAARAASNPHGLWLPDQAQALANHLAAVPALEGADLGRPDERSSSTAQTPPAQQGAPAASPEAEVEGPRTPQDDGAARMEANAGRGPNADPLEAGQLHVELADGEDQERRNQQAPGQLHVELADGEDHQAADSEGPESTADDTNRVHEVPRLSGPYVENIDGRKLRAADRAWPGTLKQHGRAAAIERVDPRVHAKMLSQLNDAISAGKDVRLVMPSNDPARVKEIIDAAKARGYEVTVSARISPPLQRQAAMLSSLNHHFHEHTLNQAITPTEHNTEQENLRKVLDQLYKHKAADRIELYPRTGDTPITSNHLVADHGPDGQLQEAVWAKNNHILDEVASLENTKLTPKEQGQIRQDMEQITDKLPAAEGLEGKRLQARNYLEKEVDSVRRKMGLPPINKTEAARAYVDTPGTHPEHETTQHHPQDPNGQKPGHDDWHLREPEDHHGPGERQPAMAGAPGEGAAYGRPQRPIPRTPSATAPTGRPPGAGPRVGPHPHRQGYGPK